MPRGDATRAGRPGISTCTRARLRTFPWAGAPMAMRCLTRATRAARRSQGWLDAELKSAPPPPPPGPPCAGYIPVKDAEGNPTGKGTGCRPACCAALQQSRIATTPARRSRRLRFMPPDCRLPTAHAASRLLPLPGCTQAARAQAPTPASSRRCGHGPSSRRGAGPLLRCSQANLVEPAQSRLHSLCSARRHPGGPRGASYQTNVFLYLFSLTFALKFSPSEDIVSHENLRVDMPGPGIPLVATAPNGSPSACTPVNLAT